MNDWLQNRVICSIERYKAWRSDAKHHGSEHQVTAYSQAVVALEDVLKDIRGGVSGSDEPGSNPDIVLRKIETLLTGNELQPGASIKAVTLIREHFNGATG